MARFPRLERLLGTEIGSHLQLEHLQHLVTVSVAEDEDLDFKREPYGPGDVGRREIAKDVAAMANHRGGVIIIGIDDAGERASECCPIDSPEDVAQRVRLVANQWVQPYLDLTVHVVDAGSSQGFVVIAIPHSPAAPHGYAEPGKETLRFPIRSGTDTRFLRVTEIADRFRNRFEAARTRAQRLDQLMDQGIAKLDLTRPWLVAGVVPEVPGSVAVDGHRMQQLQQWLSDVRPGLMDEQWPGGPPAIGMRRVHFGVSTEYGAPLYDEWTLELHADGSVFAGRALEHPVHASGQQSDDWWYVADVTIVHTLALGLRLAALYATEQAGAMGDALGEGQFVEAGRGRHEPTHSIELHWSRYTGAGFSQQQRYQPGGALLTVPPARRSMNLTAVATDPTEWLTAVRDLGNDLVQAFGMPEVRHVAPGGALRPRYWVHDATSVRQWAETAEVPLSDGAAGF